MMRPNSLLLLYLFLSSALVTSFNLQREKNKPKHLRC